MILRLLDIVRSRHLHAVALQHCRRRFKQALEGTLRAGRPRWHERVWTVQEFVHARREVYCHGPFQWDDLAELMLQYDGGPREDDKPHLKAFFESFLSLTQLRELGRFSLHQATMQISKRDCVDPRDKIYGLLSILPRQIADRVVADYTLTTEQVFMDATHAALLATNNTNILTLVIVREDRRSPLPTWAVDFADLWKRKVGAQFGLAYHNGSVWQERFMDPPEGPRFSRNGRDLAVLGSRFDIVEDTISVPLSEDDTWQPKQSIQQATEMLRRLVQKFKARPKTAYEKSVWTSFLQPDTSSVEIPFDLEPSGTEYDWLRHNDPIGFLEKVALVGNKLCDVMRQPIVSEMKSYQRYLESVSDHATVMVSVAGLLAIAPGIVRMGDIIAMVAGAHGPVMLRPERRSETNAFRGFVLLASYGQVDSLQNFWVKNGIDVERFTLR